MPFVKAELLGAGKQFKSPADTFNSENRTSLWPRLRLGRFNSDWSKTRVRAPKENMHVTTMWVNEVHWRTCLLNLRCRGMPIAPQLIQVVWTTDPVYRMTVITHHKSLQSTHQNYLSILRSYRLIKKKYKIIQANFLRKTSTSWYCRFTPSNISQILGVLVFFIFRVETQSFNKCHNFVQYNFNVSCNFYIVDKKSFALRHDTYISRLCNGHRLQIE